MKLRGTFIQPLIIFLLAVLLYSNTIHHKYALDDSIVITENQFTKKGFRGLKDIFTNDSFTGFFKKKKELVQGGRYRPLSIATFAIEYQFFGLKPSISHFINILLYGFTGIMIWLVMKRLLEDFPENEIYRILPFGTALLFVFHPLHTEVVANIKGRDELLALLLSLFSFYFSIRYSQNKKIRYLVFTAISFFLALLSKENAVTFLILIPFALLLFKNIKFKDAAITVFPMLGAFIVYYFIRIGVTGGIKQIVSAELMNNPYLDATSSQKYATIIYTLGLYLKLLVFPHPLTYDYYPYHILLQHWNFKILLILAFYLFLILYLIFTARNISKKRSRNVVFFSVFLFLINLFLVSNIPFNMGTFMNERFLYVASLGFCIFLAWLIIILTERYRKRVLFRTLILIMILLPFGLKTISRNKAWKDNYTLFTTDVKTSGNSAKGNCAAGGIIYETALTQKDSLQKMKMLVMGSDYLDKALKIYPGYADAWRLLGNIKFETGNYQDALNDYIKTLEIMPDDEAAWLNTDMTLSKYNNTDEKIDVCKKLLKIKPSRFETNYLLGNLYGKYKNNLPLAIEYLNKALTINPDSFEANKDLGVAYGLSGDFVNSVKWLDHALRINPNDADIYTNLGISYYNLNEKDKAMAYMKKGEELRQMR